MPLRDHFRPPVTKIAPWEVPHGQWPAVIVHQLRKQLPPGYISGPRVHAGAQVEIDVATYEKETHPALSHDSDGTGVATALWAPAAPSVAVVTELPDDDEYEVQIYDVERERTLVAAIEIVSPANKDRPEKRNAFIGKCAALLRNGVAVSIVDVVTSRHFNLYAELMVFLGHPDRTLGPEPPAAYAASCRWVRKSDRAVLGTWSHALSVGHPLPILPLWLTDTKFVPLDLERSYEQACEDLSIT
ncbi:DUF4058 family protein [Frigoriglobus tundricola]|uniref:Uncharacterized protein n=1 Tax=Frigoriglobus tundricola TaxID=2774151 RepID=A0A6M5Z0D0_9BACT|nr:DUF4058 family protein [Frigoriglobus tundricola]QJW99779.1 hypothetical protein FTUN_7402 [Frigoriglobus tundricola]